MKTLVAVIALFGAAFTLPVLAAPPTEQVSSMETPAITFARGRIVKVKVPAGYDSVTLERNTARRSQPWVAVSTKASSGEGEEMLFRLRSPLPARLLRVVGQKANQVVAFGGISEFFADPSGASETSLILRGEGVFPAIGGGLSLANSSVTTDAASGALSLDAGTTAPSREVVESDIWRIQGDRLYVFNPYRGLQVIDISKPDSPGMLGSLYMPSAGDDLYLLGEKHVVLLTRQTASFAWSPEVSSLAGGSVVVCGVGEGKPEIESRLPIEGRIVESRLVGKCLYVASEVQSGAGQNWRYDICITGYDLSEPAHPVARGTVKLPAPEGDAWSYLGAVQASEKYFLVATQVYHWNQTSWSNPYHTEITVVDITSPEGSVAVAGRVSTKGHVLDKFKMRAQGDLVTVISDVWNWNEEGPRRYTHLKNFEIGRGVAPRALGELDLGFNESLRGTRFDGDRVYIVTFEQVDPLWVVDNSKPAAPVVAGHLEIPGFSTYIEPLGDRLVTVGFVDGQVAVSLFDVGDAGNPKALKQLKVSERWGGSEATWDEKAFTVLAEDGLIMLPVDEWSRRWTRGGEAGEVGGIQLVDFKNDTLTLRGRIPHGFSPRRAALHRDKVLALGNASLLSVDIRDRDKPEVLADLQLAWRVDRAWHVGRHLLQVGGPVDNGENSIWVSPLQSPDEMVSSLGIGEDAVIAAEHREGNLYVLQRGAAKWVKGEKGMVYTPQPLKFSVFNTESLPALVKVSETHFSDVPAFSAGNIQLLWPTTGTLVISAVEGGFLEYPYFGLQPIAVDDFVSPDDGLAIGTRALNSSFVVAPGRIGLPYMREQTHHLVGIDVTNVKAPAFLGTQSFKPKWQAVFSESFSAGGRIYTTHQYGWGSVWILRASSEPGLVPENGREIGEELMHRGRHFLRVVDFREARKPVSMAPVSAPGRLRGLGHGGAILYTTGPDYEGEGKPRYAEPRLHASVFHGERLQLASTLPISGAEADVLPSGERLFVVDNQPFPANGDKLSRVARLVELGGENQFSVLGASIFGGWSPRAFEGMLMGSIYSGDGYSLHAVDFSVPKEPRNLGYFGVGWLGIDFNRASGNIADGFTFPVGAHGVLSVKLPE